MNHELKRNGRGWNLDPVTKRSLTRAEALARGLRPPPPRPKAPPAAVAPPLPPASPAPVIEPPRDNVLPFGRTVTLGDALAAVDLRKAGPGPDPEPDDDDDDDEFAAPPAASGPPATESPPAALAREDDDPDSFAQLAGKVATSVGVALLAGIHRRQGREPNELDDDDVEQLEEQTTKAVRRGIGDRAIPWWAPVVSAWGMAYFSMGNGAREIGRPPVDQLVPDPEAPAASSSSSAPPAARAAPSSSSRPPFVKPPPVAILNSTPRTA